MFHSTPKKTPMKSRPSFTVPVNPDCCIANLDSFMAGQRVIEDVDQVLESFDIPEEITQFLSTLRMDRGCLRDFAQDISELIELPISSSSTAAAVTSADHHSDQSSDSSDNEDRSLSEWLTNKYSSYPAGELVASSVLNLGKTQDSFVDMLIASYKSTNRQGVISSKRRISLITSKAKTIVLEFTESELDYWHFIQSVRQVATGTLDVSFTGKCRVPNKDVVMGDILGTNHGGSGASGGSGCDNDTGSHTRPVSVNLSSTPVAPRRNSIFGGSSSTPSGGAAGGAGSGGAVVTALHTVEIQGSQLILTSSSAAKLLNRKPAFGSSSAAAPTVNTSADGSGATLAAHADGSIVLTFDLLNMKCMTLSDDYDTVRKYALEVSFHKLFNPLPGVKGQAELEPSKLHVRVHIKNEELGVCNYGGRVMVPLTSTEVRSGIASAGAVQISVLHMGADSGPPCAPAPVSSSPMKLLSGSGMEEDEEFLGNVVAEHFIPFGSLVVGARAHEQQPSAVTATAGATNTSATAGGGKYKDKDTANDTVEGVNLDSPVVIDMPLKPATRGYAARIFIKSAEGLINNPVSNSVPSPYCVVYLLNDKGEKLTANSVERRTHVVTKSNDPEWNTEILLQEEGCQGIGDAAAVYIKIRDTGNSIFAKSHVHLGGVSIPIGCFLDKVEANLTLPIESSYRMDEMVSKNIISEQMSLGFISVTTELVPVRDSMKNFLPESGTLVSAGNMRTPPPKLLQPSNQTPSPVPTDLRRKLSISSPDSANSLLNQVVSVGYTLVETSSYRSWWPCRILENGGSSGGSGSSQGQGASTSFNYELCLGYGELYIRNRHVKGGLTDATIMSSPVFNSLENDPPAMTAAETEAAARMSGAGMIASGGGNAVTPMRTPKRMSFFGGKASPDKTNKPLLNRNCLVKMPYIQLLHAYQATESVVLIKIMLHVCNSVNTVSKAGGGGGTFRESLNTNKPPDMRYLPREIELLLGPVPGALLVEALLERRHVDSIRAELKHWVASNDLLLRLVSADNSALRRTFQLDMSDTAIAAVKAAAQTVSTTSANSTTSTSYKSRSSATHRFQKLAVATSICVAIEAMVETCNSQSQLGGPGGPGSAGSPGNNLKSLANSGVSNSHKRLSGSSNTGAVLGSVVAMRGSISTSGYTSSILRNRLKLYHAFLRCLSSNFIQHCYAAVALADNTDSYNHAAILTEDEAAVFCATVFDEHYIHMKKLVEADLAKAEKEEPLSLPGVTTNVILAVDAPVQSSSRAVVRRLEAIVDKAVQHVREFILMYNVESFANHNTPLVTPLQELIKEYHVAMLAILNPLVSTKEGFAALLGEELRTGLVKFLINKNACLDNALRAILAPMGLAFVPSCLLVEEAHVETLISWYGQGLIHTLKTWCNKTLVNASTMKDKSHKLPWDISVTNMLTYTSSSSDQDNDGGDADSQSSPAACEEDGGRGSPVHIRMKYYISSVPEVLRRQINVYLDLCTASSSHVNNNGDDADDEAGGTFSSLEGVSNSKELRYLLLLNEKIIGAVAKALIMLSDSYERSMQSKNWAMGSTDEEIADNLAFLISIVNDTYRLRQIHTQPLLSIPTLHTPVAKTVMEVRESFLSVHDQAVIQISRVIFTDLHSTFIDFTSLWLQNASQTEFKTSSTDSTVGANFLVATVVATLRDYFNDLQYNLHINSFSKITLQCGELCIMRYLAFVKELAKMNRKFDERNHEVQRVRQDIMCLISFFVSTMRQIAALLPQRDKMIVWNAVNSHPVYADLGHSDVDEGLRTALAGRENAGAAGVNTHNDNASTKMNTAALSSSSAPALCIKLCGQLQFLVDMLDLLSLSMDDVSLTVLLRRLSKKYAVDDYRMVLVNLLSSCMLTVRPSSDSDLDLLQQVSALLGSNASGDTEYQRGAGIAPDDLFVRVFRDDENIKLNVILKESHMNKHAAVEATSMTRPMMPAKSSSTAFSIHKQRASFSMAGLAHLRAKEFSQQEDSLKPSSSGHTSLSHPLLHKGQASMRKILGYTPTVADGSVNNGSVPDDQSSVCGTELSGVHNVGGSVTGGNSHSNSNITVNNINSSSITGGEMTSLLISKLSVRGLKTSGFMGKINPYCVLLLNTPVSSVPVRIKTAVKWDVKGEATWEHLGGSLTLPVRRSMVENCTLTIYCYDKDRIVRKKFLGGVAAVKLSGVEVHKLSATYEVDSTIVQDDHGNTVHSSSSGQMNVKEVYIEVELPHASISEGESEAE